MRVGPSSRRAPLAPPPRQRVTASEQKVRRASENTGTRRPGQAGVVGREWPGNAGGHGLLRTAAGEDELTTSWSALRVQEKGTGVEKKNERTQCETKVNLKLFFFFYFHFFFVSPVFVCNRCFFIFGFGWRASLAVVFVSVRNFFFCAFSGRLESVFDALFPSCVNPLKTKPSNCPPVFSSSFIAFLSLPQRKTRGESCPTGKRTRKSRPV